MNGGPDYRARPGRRRPLLVLLPIGKLTNRARPRKAPAIAKVRIVARLQLPEARQYNQHNDEGAMNSLLDANVPFEIVTVRYGEPSGTDAVRATLQEVREIMPGKGPRIDTPITGRHGGEFATFGDYALNLFENIRLHGDPPSRALFDMAAVAIVKNPGWAESRRIPAPTLADRKWVERPGNTREVVLWENFDRKAIMADFYDQMGTMSSRRARMVFPDNSKPCLNPDSAGAGACPRAHVILAFTRNSQGNPRQIRTATRWESTRNPAARLAMFDAAWKSSSRLW